VFRTDLKHFRIHVVISRIYLQTLGMGIKVAKIDVKILRIGFEILLVAV
jgi:hypothetical protein